nr:hypothetical protein [Tanacetum cinerariifolium]
MAGVKTGFEPGLAVVEFERIDIPHDLPTPDTMERLGQVEEGHVMALEGSNTRLQDALGVERVRADNL